MADNKLAPFELNEEEAKFIVAWRRLNDGIIAAIERFRKVKKTLVEAVDCACNESYGSTYYIRRKCEELIKQATTERVVTSGAYYNGYFGYDKNGIIKENLRLKKEADDEAKS